MDGEERPETRVCASLLRPRSPNHVITAPVDPRRASPKRPQASGRTRTDRKSVRSFHCFATGASMFRSAMATGRGASRRGTEHASVCCVDYKKMRSSRPTLCPVDRGTKRPRLLGVRVAARTIRGSGTSL